MKKNKLLPLVVLVLIATTDVQAGGLTLSYEQPSPSWMGSLPLGNGRLGVMVYGGTDMETIALSEVTLWSGQPDPDCNNMLGPDRLKEIRSAFLSGDYRLGNEMGWRSMNGHGRSFGTNLPLGNIVISTPGSGSSPTTEAYSRELSLDEAVARVSYTINKVEYRREYLCSNPDQVLAVSYKASRRGAINVDISMNLLRHAKVEAQGNMLDIVGDARFDKFGEGGVRFRGMLSAQTDGGGTVSAEGDRLAVRGATELTLVFDLRTDFQNLKYREQCYETVKKASAKTFDELKRAHVRDYQPLFRRMSIDLGPNVSGAKTTDQMFAQAHEGKSNPAFDALFFQYGRYMQISSSRENSPLPSNLQGVWNDNLACNMPWTCDYHLDINIQQNYWSANIANLSETNTPLFGYIALLAKYGHDTARKLYGCDGWVTHTINNVWGDTAPGSSLGWALNVTAGAWLATHLWTHFEFTQDREYLRQTGYPLLKETAQFFVDYMVEDPKTGQLLSGPSISPENSFCGADGRDYSLSMMPTTDRATIYEIYHACIEASRILDIDADFRSRLERDIRRLPPYWVRSNGELAEWLLDVGRSDPSHRHAAHLLGLYPYGHIAPDVTPELAKACSTFLANQESHPNWEDTEWTRGSNINFYARLFNGEKAYKSLLGLYSGFMRENLMTVSPAGIAGAESDIFSFDATEAAVAGTCEMLLQSRCEADGIFLHFLPALPDVWKDGSVRGICARGGIEVDMTWRDKHVVKVTLRAKTAQRMNININGQKKTIRLLPNKSYSL
ncbi:MAG: glycoside hydrolase N-terminal domain-containing protein [Prevotella sp.]|nr:glycoside hydrolase N-terminal domain-containing protein [Prevotella sp.]